MNQQILTLILAGCLSACVADDSAGKASPDPGASSAVPFAADNSQTRPATETQTVPDQTNKPQTRQLATFGAGCFWCVEAVLEQLDGVTQVSSGYMGGSLENPSYDAICSGDTGHAEVVQAEFDPAKISYDTLLKWFFKLHDPTTLNRQGADVGTQYRSVIFYHSPEQKAAALRAKKIIGAARVFPDPIVTEISPAMPYYIAEDKHQDFYRRNKTNGYCRAVITPKLDKLGLER